VDVEEDIVGKSLLEILREVAVDPAEQAALADMGAAPYLARYGFHDVDVEDVREAVDLVADTLPPEVAQTLAFARSELAQGVGPSEALGVAAYGDAAEQLDGIPHQGGDADGGVAPGAGISDEAHRTSNAVGDPETSLTFGAGAETEAPGQGDVVGHEAHNAANGDHGALEGDAVGAQGSFDMPPDLDSSASVEEAGTLASDVDENASYELPDDPAVLDDIGSF
jgi:hypothetical protein